MGVKNCIDCDKKEAIIDCNCVPVENADGTLQDVVLGCTDPLAANYNALANCDDGSCIELMAGCMDPAVTNLNYNICYNADCAGNIPGSAAYITAGTYGDTSCCCTTAGCMDSNATNYNSGACLDDGSCTYPGCTDNTACNYIPAANVDDGSCVYPTTANETASDCDPYYWAIDGNTYPTSGTYTHVGTGSNGCDLTTTLNLTILSATSNTSNVNECDDYTWPINGTNYTASGTYTDTGTNAAGCTHTETLNLTIDPSGCTTPTSLNYDPSAICDDGSCIAPVGGCTYGPTGSLPVWTSVIGDGGTNTASTWAALYSSTQPTDPGIEATNYNSGANVEDGSCTFCVYGCSDPTACNYNPLTTCEAVGSQGTGECEWPTTQDLSEASYGQGSPNCIRAGGDGCHDEGCSTSFQFPCANPSGYGMAAFPYEAGEPMFGAHCTEHAGTSLTLNGSSTNNTGSVYSESYSFMATNLTPQNHYCINWAEIVMALRHSQCSDCLMGGWWFKMDTGTGTPSWTDINNATSIYDPVTGVVSTGTSPGTLTTASACYNAVTGGATPPYWSGTHSDYIVQCATNVPGNPGNANTAGASNGSCSVWNEKCITFEATAATHRIMVAAITDFDLCTTCHCGLNASKHGTYVGISKVMISSDGCSSGNCVCS